MEDDAVDWSAVVGLGDGDLTTQAARPEDDVRDIATTDRNLRGPATGGRVPADPRDDPSDRTLPVPERRSDPALDQDETFGSFALDDPDEEPEPVLDDDFDLMPPSTQPRAPRTCHLTATDVVRS